MDADYPWSVFRAAVGSAMGRSVLFFASFWGGSLVGEFVVTHRWHELGLLPVSSLFHVALAIAHLWGILLVAGIGWMFYALLWRDAPPLLSVLAVGFLQAASVHLFTPGWMRAAAPSQEALLLKVLLTGAGVLFFVLANRRLADP